MFILITHFIQLKMNNFDNFLSIKKYNRDILAFLFSKFKFIEHLNLNLNLYFTIQYYIIGVGIEPSNLNKGQKKYAKILSYNVKYFVFYVIFLRDLKLLSKIK